MNTLLLTLANMGVNLDDVADVVITASRSSSSLALWLPPPLSY